MRAKLPKGRRFWPAFRTLDTPGGWPRGGGVDILA
jgi:beta-glucanase (GH16 family)